MEESSVPIIAVVGPTASGKTSLAVSLCISINGEVVSCDSMQIYQNMPIATALPSADEMRGVPHHLMNFVSPQENFSVAKYCEMAKKCIFDIHARGKMPMLAGGTGLYYSSLVDNIEFIEEQTDFEYRAMLKERANLNGAGALLEELRAVDPEAASKLHVNNLGRIIRALEIYHSTGVTKTEQELISRQNSSPFAPIVIGLDARDREFLYKRINQRVDEMLAQGLVDEASAFYARYGVKTAAQAIGYKELKAYLDGKEELHESVERLKMQTRRYAKRQLTWFRRDKRVNWLYIDEYQTSTELLNAAAKIIAEANADEK